MKSCTRSLIPKGDPTFILKKSLNRKLPVIDSPPGRNYDIAADSSRIRMRPKFLLKGSTGRSGVVISENFFWKIFCLYWANQSSRRFKTNRDERSKGPN